MIFNRLYHTLYLYLRLLWEIVVVLRNEGAPFSTATGFFKIQNCEFGLALVLSGSVMHQFDH